MRTLIFLALSLCVSLLFSPASAQNQYPGKMSFEFEGQSAVTGDPSRPSSDGARVLIKYDGILTMGTLLGEPVIMVRMKYNLLGGSVTIPTFEPGDSAYETIDLDQIPSKARSLVDLYGFKMAFHFTTAGPERVMVIEDGGAVMKADQYSFNVPGSPDWDEVFVVSLGDWTDRGIEYMSAEEAFAIWKGGLNLFDVEVHDVKMTMHDLHLWWAENNERPRYRAALRALKRVEEGIGIAYGFNTAANEVLSVNPTLQEAYTAFNTGEADQTSFGGELYGLSDRDDYLPEYARAADLVEEALRKLQFLPENLKEGDNHLPYYTAVGQANEILGQVAEWRRTYLSEEVDPHTLPVGEEQEFDDERPLNEPLAGWPKVSGTAYAGVNLLEFVDQNGTRLDRLEYGALDESNLLLMDSVLVSVVHPADWMFALVQSCDEGLPFRSALKINGSNEDRVLFAPCERKDFVRFATTHRANVPSIATWLPVKGVYERHPYMVIGLAVHQMCLDGSGNRAAAEKVNETYFTREVFFEITPQMTIGKNFEGPLQPMTNGEEISMSFSEKGNGYNFRVPSELGSRNWEEYCAE